MRGKQEVQSSGPVIKIGTTQQIRKLLCLPPWIVGRICGQHTLWQLHLCNDRRPFVAPLIIYQVSAGLFFCRLSCNIRVSALKPADFG